MGHRTIRRRADIHVQSDELRRRIEMLERRQPPEMFAVYEMKLFADANALDGNLPADATDVVTGDGKFIFGIDPELDEWYVVQAHAFVSTVGGGATVVEVENLTQAHVIVAAVTIPAGEFMSSCDPDDFASVNYANDQVEGCDMISLNVTSAGAGAQGLGVILTLSGTPGDELVT